MRREFREIIADRHGYARDWKRRTGKKVLGYLCTYMPEEMAYAAGMLPVRILAGENPPDRAERYMAQWTCPFSHGAPPATGAGALEMVLSSQLMDKEEHNSLVSQWLEKGVRPSGGVTGGVRIMVVGSCVDKPEVLNLIEGMGADVVIDEMCTGTRYFWDDVEPDREPLFALARRLVDRVNCPAKLAGERRYRHALKLARDFSVQGVIVLHQKFCNPHGNDYPFRGEPGVDQTRHSDRGDVPPVITAGAALLVQDKR